MDKNVINFGDEKAKKEMIEKAKEESIQRLLHFSRSYYREVKEIGYENRLDCLSDAIADYNNPDLQF